MSKLVVLRRCATIEEAFVIDSLLQDGGFLSSTPVRYHVQNNWLAAQAFNGIPVFIPEAELFEAAGYLIEMRASAKERLEGEFGEIDNGKLPLRWGRAFSMMFLFFGGGYLLIIPLAYLLAALPVDWAGLEHNRDYYPIFRSSTVSPWGRAVHRVDGLIFVAFIVLFLIWDITSVTNKKHTEEETTA